MARTDAERLEFYLDLRDQLDDAILAAFSAGAPVKRYRIGTREVEREDLKGYLAEVQGIIDTLTAVTNAATSNGRNLVRLRRYE